MKNLLKKILLTIITVCLIAGLLPVINKTVVKADYTARIAICSTYGSPYTVFVSNVWDELEKRGCYVERITSSTDISNWDALIVPGGMDVDPSNYGESNYACGSTDREFDAEQLAIIDKFVKAEKPIYGMCRGLQILNVYFGGSLYQNISGHNGGIYTYGDTVSGSMMEDLIGDGASTYCYHHQCIKSLGSGFVATMWSGDVIEAIEHTSLPILATQWHPEKMSSNAGKKVLDYFVYEMVCGYRHLSQGSDGNWYAYFDVSGNRSYMTGYLNNDQGRWRVENGRVNFDFEDITYESGQWRYYYGGKWQRNSSTVAANSLGWWYVENGVVNFDYTGFADNWNGRWRIENSQVNFNYNDIAYDNGTWRYYRGGRWQSDTTTLASNSLGWWYVDNGVVDFSYTGLAQNDLGWWYIVDSKVNFDFTGFADDYDGRWRIEGGKINFNYSDIAYDEGQWRYYSGGLWKRDVNTVANNSLGWWYVKDGVVDFSFNGFAQNSNGWWLINDGKVNFDYTGFADDYDGRWRVEGGRLNGNYADIAYDEGQWRYYSGGRWQTGVETVAPNSLGWWYVRNGVVDFTYTGYASNQYGWWYIVDGKVDFSRS